VVNNRIILLVKVRGWNEKKEKEVIPPCSHGRAEGRYASAVLRVHEGAGPEELVNHLFVAAQRGQVERRVPVGVLGADIGAAGQERADHRRGSKLRGDEERRRASLVPRLEIGSGPDPLPQRGDIVVSDGAKDRRRGLGHRAIVVRRALEVTVRVRFRSRHPDRYFVRWSPCGGEAFTRTPARHFIFTVVSSAEGLAPVNVYSPGATWT